MKISFLAFIKRLMELLYEDTQAKDVVFGVYHRDEQGNVIKKEYFTYDGIQSYTYPKVIILINPSSEEIIH
jgi:hypothetical protein